MKYTKQGPNLDRAAHGQGKKYIFLGWSFAVISIFFIPLLFGTLGVIMGILANRKGKKGDIIITFSVIFALMGLALSTLIMRFFRTYLEVLTIMY